MLTESDLVRGPLGELKTGALVPTLSAGAGTKAQFATAAVLWTESGCRRKHVRSRAGYKGGCPSPLKLSSSQPTLKVGSTPPGMNSSDCALWGWRFTSLLNE